MNHDALTQTNHDKYCPSQDWIFCSKGGDNCQINSNIKLTTTSFGLYNSQKLIGSWMFWDISNFASNIFKLACNTDLGDPWDGPDKGCRERISTSAVYAQSTFAVEKKEVHVLYPKIYPKIIPYLKVILIVYCPIDINSTSFP